jgi:hypothetical protein
LLLSMNWSLTVLGCPRCATAGVVRAAAFGPGFGGRILLMALPFLVLAAATVTFGAERRASHPAVTAAGGRRAALIRAATLLGIGLGGFVDGIVLHQILQWHNMLSSRVEPVDLVSMKYNMLWDGLFHAFTWLATVVGIGLLWRAGANKDVAWSTRTFVGSLIRAGRRRA